MIVCHNFFVGQDSTVYDTSKIPPVGVGSVGVADLSEMAEYKYPNPSCAEQ